MEGFGILFIAIFIISSIINSAKSNRKNDMASGAERQSSGQKNGIGTRTGYTASVTNAQRARLEELRKKQQQSYSAASNAKQEKAYREKPIRPHKTDECGGGSIHDGYHEGTFRRPAQASSAEGMPWVHGAMEREGLSLTERTVKETDDDALATLLSVESKARSSNAQKAKNGAEKLSKAIADKPAIVQGLIWAEVLGRPGD